MHVVGFLTRSRSAWAEYNLFPIKSNIAELAGTLGQQMLQLGGDALAFGSRTPGLEGILQAWESSPLIGFEPGANGVFIAF
jgi:hypothetical protein